MPTASLPPGLRRLLRAITWLENSALLVLLAAMVVLGGAQIVFRNLFDLNVLGVDQLLRLLVLWVALLGAIAASREGKHIHVDAIARWLPPRVHAGVQTLTDLFTIGVCTLLAWESVRFIENERATGDKAFGALPAWVAELILPVAFTLIALRYALLLRHHLRQALGREAIT
jgi:TRAP-type C4-dicarboxylate transport system permease small subunit